MDKVQKITLKPGEMLLYESAAAPHGRPYPLKGEYFDNLFVHFTLDYPQYHRLIEIKKRVDQDIF